MPAGGCSIHPFDEPTLAKFLGRVDRPAFKYLHAYLVELGAVSVVVEDHYIDRHYLDDFARYYSRSFAAPPAYCKRLHFFTLDPAKLDALFTKSCESVAARTEVENTLVPPTGDQPYLGFVVRRPLADAAIGRTVLKTYPADGGRRHFEVVRDYRVHLLGLTLKVQGLAYQQQDRGAAVCASTALWSAL